MNPRTKVDKRSQGDCWPWPGPLDRDGYGRENHGQMAHRLMYERILSPISDGLTIEHLCHTRDLDCFGGVTCPHRRCVNPFHMECITSAENKRRRHIRPAEPPSQCINGHAYAPENTYIKPDGNRDCRVCIRDRVRRYKQRKQAA